ncbi:hypothetical protein LJR118_000267 [Acidovorax sp. LjRoot118]|uniref:hypothetical protein n=1 Tax=Acidovorax sp. LjRoot118 TaxID=3342256 RepID=UPI003ED09352
MLTFRIKVPGRIAYDGIFASYQAAQADAERQFPGSHPACVICLSRKQQGGAS